MGLFDLNENITNIQLNTLLSPINDGMEFVFGSKDLFFIEEESERVAAGLMPIIRKSNLSTVSLYYKDILNIVDRFNKNYNNIQINTNTNKSIPEQLDNIFHEYLPTPSTTCIITTPYFISFNSIAKHYYNQTGLSVGDHLCSIIDELFIKYFNNIYNGYIIRHSFGQRGFESSPDSIGYMHVLFHSNAPIGHDCMNTLVHWFKPLVVVSDR